MKETPQEKRIRARMMPGIITLTGFLGKDKRSISEIVSADESTLENLGRTPDEVAARMQFFTDATFDVFDAKVVLENKYEIETEVTRGKLSCPYSHGGLIRKLITTLTNRKNGLTVRWTALNIHLIKEHHFFEGKGSTFRLEPADLVKALFD
jgi:hypothetical protein